MASCPGLERRRHIRTGSASVVISGANSFYKSNSTISLNVDVFAKKDHNLRIEAKEDQLALFDERGGPAGFEKKFRFPEPMTFYKDGLPASKYVIKAEFEGNDKAARAVSDPVEFTVFEQDTFEPSESESKWYQVSTAGTKEKLQTPFSIRSEPTSHKGENALFIEPRLADLNAVPMLWYRSEVRLPCEVHLSAGPISLRSAAVISFDDVFRITIGFDPASGGSSEGRAFLSIFQRVPGSSTFAEIQAVEIPNKLLSQEESYQVRLWSSAGSPGVYGIRFDIPDGLPSPLNISFTSPLKLPPKGDIGISGLSQSDFLYFRQFQVLP